MKHVIFSIPLILLTSSVSLSQPKDSLHADIKLVRQLKNSTNTRSEKKRILEAERDIKDKIKLAYKKKKLEEKRISTTNKLANKLAKRIAKYVKREKRRAGRKEEKEERKSLILEEDGKDTVNLTFVGAGDVQKSLSEGSEFAANTGVGAIYSRQWQAVDSNGIKRIVEFFELGITINVASTVDSVTAEYTDGVITNRGDFGSFLLLPTSSGQSAQLDLNMYFTNKRMPICPYWTSKKNFSPFYLTNILNGIYFNFSASNRIFSDSIESKNATGLLLSVGFFHDFIPEEIRISKGHSIKFGVGYTYRGIYGNSGIKTEASSNFRNVLLGTDMGQFHGWEIFASLKLHNIEARFSLPNLNGNVPGLSQTQFITSIGFVGGFPIPIKLKNNPKRGL